MKRFFTLGSAFLFFFFILFNQTKLISHPNQPDAGYVNDPDPGGALTCATSGCHSGTAIADSTKFTVSMGLFSAGSGAQTDVTSGVTTYYADSVYYMTVTGNGTSNKYGFELTVVDNAASPGNMAGVIALTNTATTTLGTYQPSGSTMRQYAGHKNASTIKTWTFKWTAPHTNLGPLTIYYCGMNSNGNNSSSGDIVYKSTRVIAEATPVVNGIENIQSKVNFFHLSPPVFTGDLQLSFDLKQNSDVSAQLISLNGEVVKTLINETISSGIYQSNFDLSNLSAGLYLVRLNIGNSSTVQKIVKQ